MIPRGASSRNPSIDRISKSARKLPADLLFFFKKTGFVFAFAVGACYIISYLICGEMAEWSKAQHWKCCIGATLSWVQIPLSPPFYFKIERGKIRHRLKRVKSLCQILSLDGLNTKRRFIVSRYQWGQYNDLLPETVEKAKKRRTHQKRVR